MFTTTLLVITKSWKQPKFPRKEKGSQSISIVPIHPHNASTTQQLEYELWVYETIWVELNIIMQ